MKNVVELLIAFNLGLFVLNTLFAGLSLAQGLYRALGMFAICAVIHGLAADYFKTYKDKKYPAGKIGSP